MVSTKPRVNFAATAWIQTCGLPVHLHAVAFLQLRGIAGNIACDRRVADGAELLAQAVALGVNVNLFEAPPCARDDADRKCVNEFVREKTTRDGRKFVKTGEQPDLALLRYRGQPRCNALALGSARFDGDVFQRCGELRQCPLRTNSRNRKRRARALRPSPPR